MACYLTTYDFYVRLMVAEDVRYLYVRVNIYVLRYTDAPTVHGINIL
jgi:hypothetical protein